MNRTNRVVRNLFAVIGWGCFVVVVYFFAEGEGRTNSVKLLHSVCLMETTVVFSGDNVVYRCIKDVKI